MLKHVVMFKIKENPQETAVELKRRLMALPSQIEEIKHFEVGINCIESARAYDVVLVSEFENVDTLKAYQVHPAHQEVLKFSGEVSESIIAVDYED